jgi:hypothetical protein
MLNSCHNLEHLNFLAFFGWECYSDPECNAPNGYCHQGKCICLAGYNYAFDCSMKGSKFLLTNRKFACISPSCLEGHAGFSFDVYLLRPFLY